MTPRHGWEQEQILTNKIIESQDGRFDALVALSDTVKNDPTLHQIFFVFAQTEITLSELRLEMMFLKDGREKLPRFVLAAATGLNVVQNIVGDG